MWESAVRDAAVVYTGWIAFCRLLLGADDGGMTHFG